MNAASFGETPAASGALDDPPGATSTGGLQGPSGPERVTALTSSVPGLCTYWNAITAPPSGPTPSFGTSTSDVGSDPVTSRSVPQMPLEPGRFTASSV